MTNPPIWLPAPSSRGDVESRPDVEQRDVYPRLHRVWGFLGGRMSGGPEAASGGTGSAGGGGGGPPGGGRRTEGGGGRPRGRARRTMRYGHRTAQPSSTLLLVDRCRWRSTAPGSVASRVHSQGSGNWAK